MTGMRILVLSSFYPPHHLGGYEIACESAVRGLRERGHELRVVTSRHRTPDVSEDGDADRVLHLFWEAGEWRRPGLAGAVRATREDLRALERIVDEFRPDAVWAWHMAALSKSLLQWCLGRGLPLALAVHDLWPLYDIDPDPWLRWTRGARAPVGGVVGRMAGLPTRPLDLRGAAAVSYNSEWTRGQVAGSGLVPDGPVVYPGLDAVAFRPTPLRADAIRRFLVVGRVERRKGPSIAVEALARLRAAGIGDATLHLHGRSERGHRAELERLAGGLGLADAVTFGESSDRGDMGAVYAGHDAVIHAATWDEPFGLTIAEAMATGRPVIASPTGGATEIVHDGNALTFRPGDVDGCAKRMWQLASDPGLADRLVTEGLRTAERFTERAATDAHERHLMSALTG
jgi:glycosyltransferase involved in cell wall biosynthesis